MIRRFAFTAARAFSNRLVMGGGAMPAGVPSFVRKRRARQDSKTGLRPDAKARSREVAEAW
jgi:hypothetical protein